jgi:exosortase/archaeosortase family protein
MSIHPILRALVVLAAFHALYVGVLPNSGFLEVLLGAIAASTCSLLELFGFEITRSGTAFTVNAHTYSIVQGCDGLQVFGVAAAAIVASPVRNSARCKGLLLAAPFCVILNLLRITTIVLIGISMPSIESVVHYHFWPMLQIIAIVLGWCAWFSMASRDGR